MNPESLRSASQTRQAGRADALRRSVPFAVPCPVTKACSPGGWRRPHWPPPASIVCYSQSYGWTVSICCGLAGVGGSALLPQQHHHCAPVFPWLQPQAPANPLFSLCVLASLESNVLPRWSLPPVCVRSTHDTHACCATTTHLAALQGKAFRHPT